MRYLFCLCVLLASSLCTRGEDVLQDLRAGHPRLLLTPGSIVAIRAAEKTDPLRAKLHRHLIAAAEKQLLERPIRYVLVGPRMLDQSRAALGQVTTSAFAYLLTGDERFFQHARKVMLTAAAFPDWNPSHFLDVAEMATALALGYDWLHTQLSPEDRAVIARALRDKALAYAAPAYSRADPNRISFPFVQGNLANNWNQVCNGGFTLAALALADEEPALAREVIAGLRDTLPYAMKAYEPDGAYPEGPVYWGYGTGYNVMILAALDSALGREFNLGEAPAFHRTAYFRLQVQSPTRLSFNFADGRPEMGADPTLTWLGLHYRIPAAVSLSRRLLMAALTQLPDRPDRSLALHAIWFPPEQPASEPPPLDVEYEGPSKLAIFRSAWNDPQAIWTGLKAGSNLVNHGHLDLGAFMLDADGERWAVDLGPDNYNLPGYWDKETAASPRWQYYRLNNFSHNTITPGDLLQEPAAEAPLIAYGSTPARAFVVTDLGAAYPTAAARFQRGLALLDRARVLVQDEVTGLRAGVSLTWRMLTGARVTLGPDSRTATLTQHGRTLRLELLTSAPARFTTRAARPPTAAENQNEGITELRAEVPAMGDSGDVQLAVLLSPVGQKWPVLPLPALTPLTQWK